MIASDPTAATATATVTVSASAHLLEYRRGQFVAFPQHVVQALIACPAITAMADAPYFCAGFIAWQSGQIPLLDINMLLRAYPEKRPVRNQHALILAYQTAPNTPLQYGAVYAPDHLPEVAVTDAQACDLPNDSDLWPCIAMSCFQEAAKPMRTVPILDTAALFAQLDA